MKNKKIFLMFLLLLTCFILIACDPPQFYHTDLSGKVVKIELIKYDNANAKNVTVHKTPEKYILPFDFSKVEIIETLPVEKNEIFLNDLSKIYLIANWTFANSPLEHCVRLIFYDNSFEIISYSKNNKRLLAIYNEHGEPIQYVGGIDGRDSFINLVNEYFKMQLE